ncbi:MAG: hypothetical protein EOO38_07335 [Cytophagaceae bacterium]|nr:MAG: hypothetical protein EOO38_07335 [Cytophagaceae bacterium]
MDSYLALAERVLASEKRALSPLEILRTAYRLGLAPSHLRGRTQHKTLQARLSVDILRFRENSAFYRTAPGKFFLTRLRSDPDVPESDRSAIVARRRRRALPMERALAIKTDVLLNLMKNDELQRDGFQRLISRGCYHYARSSNSKDVGDSIVWAFALVIKSGKVLSYRTGPYREQRDNFLSKRAIGFYSPVVDDDMNLFDQADHGVVWSGIKALANDLDLYDERAWRALQSHCVLERLVVHASEKPSSDLLAVVSFKCPDWLEPTSSRLAINDLQWLDLKLPINHQEDFDPWSQALIAEARRITMRH